MYIYIYMHYVVINKDDKDGITPPAQFVQPCQTLLISFGSTGQLPVSILFGAQLRLDDLLYRVSFQ